MADPALITGATGALLAIAQTVSSVFKVGDLKKIVTRIVDKDIPGLRADLTALADRVDGIKTTLRRAATASQPGTSIIGEIQGLRDRITAMEHKLQEQDRRAEDLRKAFEAHKEKSDESWHDLTLELTEISGAIRGIEGLGGGRNARSGRGA